jgi:hypothetical protein
MALDALLKIVTAMSVDTGTSTTQTSATFDFATALGASGDKQGLPEGLTFVVADVTNGPEVGALPIKIELQLSIDGTNFRSVCAVTMTNAKAEVKSARFGLLDFVPEAAVIAGTDRAAAVDLKARVVCTYTNSAGTFIFSAYLAGPQHIAAFVE